MLASSCGLTLITLDDPHKTDEIESGADRDSVLSSGDNDNYLSGSGRGIFIHDKGWRPFEPERLQ